MNKRVYGIIGIKSIMANWNADFTGYPKSISNGDIFGSDKALKYTMKKMMENQGEKVLYIKSLKLDNEKKASEKKIRPKSLKERYEEIFQVEDLSKEKNGEKVIKNIFTAIDVKNFGATFAEAGNNLSITGAVQIGQGFNKYKESNVEEQQILSPFRDGTKDEADSSTLGTKVVSDEAHYFYPFVITPSVYNNYKEMGVTDGYTYDDYKKFKDISLISATAFNTNAKLGCENEFALFIECDEELYIPDICQYIEFNKKDEKNIITFNFNSIIDAFKDRIFSMEIYYNNIDTEIVNKLEDAKYFNIYTREEI